MIPLQDDVGGAVEVQAQVAPATEDTTADQVRQLPFHV